MKEQEQEADRKGPGRPCRCPIEITDGTVAIDDKVGFDAPIACRRTSTACT